MKAPRGPATAAEATALRRQSEAQLGREPTAAPQTDPSAPTGAAVQRLLHELQVHQTYGGFTVIYGDLR